MSLFSKRKKKQGAPKPAHTVKEGSIVAEFYTDKERSEGNYLRVYAPGTPWEMRVIGYPYGYLLAAVKQGDRSEVIAYALTQWRLQQELYQDEEFAHDIANALNARDERLDLQAQQEALVVTDEQEQAAQAVMEDVAEYADARDDEERQEIVEGWRRDIEELNPEADGE